MRRRARERHEHEVEAVHMPPVQSAEKEEDAMSSGYYVGKVPETKSAEGLLFNSYIKSLWDMGGMRAQLRYSEFCDVAHRRLELLLSNRPVLLGLRHELTPDWLGGWLLAHHEGSALYVHFAYVKHPFRRQGYATALLDAALERTGEPERLYATHDHPRWRELIARKGFELKPLSALRSATFLQEKSS